MNFLNHYFDVIKIKWAAITFFVFAAQMVFAQIPEIIQKPISYGEERQELSLQYLKEHYGIEIDSPTINPRMIVLHYTAGGTLETNFQLFNSPYLNADRKAISSASGLNVSAHFLVDKDGTIYQLMEPTQFARHVIGLNYMAIGIENVAKNASELTNEQIEANAQLIRYLTNKYPIEYLIGHHEYTRFKGSKLWKEKNPNYLTEKHDPGNAFMEEVRNKISDLGLKNSPD